MLLRSCCCYFFQCCFSLRAMVLGYCRLRLGLAARVVTAGTDVTLTPRRVSVTVGHLELLRLLTAVGEDDGNSGATRVSVECRMVDVTKS
jgi:hypothetical protein